MNLKMLALSAQGDAGTSKMLARISGAFSGFADETEFAVYDSLKTLLPPFAEALWDCVGNSKEQIQQRARQALCGVGA